MSTVATLIPDDVFEHIGRNAGIILSDFDTTTKTVDKSKIIGATSGGVNFTDTPTYTDFGEDIDNCPKNTKELKELDSREVKISGTYVSMTIEQNTDLIGAADYDAKTGKITIRDEVTVDDFKTIWFIFDYGNGGVIAIKINNALSTGGFAVQTTEKAKATYAFEYTAHYGIEDSTKPYEIYYIANTATAAAALTDDVEDTEGTVAN